MFIRILKYSIKNILRNKFLSISSILVLTLLMFFINILLVLHSVSFKLIDSINSKLTISLYLKETYDKNSLEVIDFMRDLSNISKSIVSTYKSKDELKEEMKQRDPKLVWILWRDNPLPNTITVSNVALDEYESLNNIIERKMYLLDNWWSTKDKSFANYNSQYEKIINVISTLNTLRLGLYAIISIFLLSISVIVYSIIWNFIYYYKDEIYVTKLVWWNNLFIYWPFSLQWIIYSIVSFFFSAFFFILLLNNINYLFPSDWALDFLFNNIYFNFWIEILLFSLIWWISWYFSSKKYI